jgi:hypothetical protein
VFAGAGARGPNDPGTLAHHSWLQTCSATYQRAILVGASLLSSENTTLRSISEAGQWQKNKVVNGIVEIKGRGGPDANDSE